MYIVAAKKIKDRRQREREHKRKKRTREFSSVPLFRRTLIVNMEDRRHNRNSDYGEKQRKRERKCNRFPASERTRKILLNTRNRMGAVTVSSIVCVGCFADQFQHVYMREEKRRQRRGREKRRRRNEHMQKKGYSTFRNCYSSISHHQF